MREFKLKDRAERNIHRALMYGLCDWSPSPRIGVFSTNDFNDKMVRSHKGDSSAFARLLFNESNADDLSYVFG